LTQPGGAAADEDSQGEMELPATFLAAHNYLPAVVDGECAMALRSGREDGRLFGVSWRVAYRRPRFAPRVSVDTAFYAGQPSSKPVSRSRQKVAQPAKRSSAHNFLERELPGVPERSDGFGAGFIPFHDARAGGKNGARHFLYHVAVLGTMMFSRAVVDCRKRPNH